MVISSQDEPQAADGRFDELEVSLAEQVTEIHVELTGLAAQHTELRQGLNALQRHLDGQKAEIEALASELAAFTETAGEQTAATTAQLQALAETIELQAALPSVPVPTAVGTGYTDEEAVPAAAAVQPLPTAAPLPVAEEEGQVGRVISELGPQLVIVERSPGQLVVVAKIRPRDTVWGWADRFQSPPTQKFINEIIELNQVDPYSLSIGQELLIPLSEDLFRYIETE